MLVIIGAGVVAVLLLTVLILQRRKSKKLKNLVERACSTDSEERAEALEEMVAGGLDQHANFLFDAAEWEKDLMVSHRLAKAIAESDDDSGGVAGSQLRAWAAAQSTTPNRPSTLVSTPVIPSLDTDTQAGLGGEAVQENQSRPRGIWGETKPDGPVQPNKPVLVDLLDSVAGSDDPSHDLPEPTLPDASRLDETLLDVRAGQEEAPTREDFSAERLVDENLLDERLPASQTGWNETLKHDANSLLAEQETSGETTMIKPSALKPLLASLRPDSQQMEKAEKLAKQLANANMDRVIIESDGYNLVIDAQQGVTVEEAPVAGLEEPASEISSTSQALTVSQIPNVGQRPNSEVAVERSLAESGDGLVGNDSEPEPTDSKIVRKKARR